jgi:glycine betaine/proline transport system ATP-binding protein
MESMKSPKIVVEGLCKVFGDNPKVAREMLARGATKDEVFAKTGHVVGVHNVSSTSRRARSSC